VRRLYKGFSFTSKRMGKKHKDSSNQTFEKTAGAVLLASSIADGVLSKEDTALGMSREVLAERIVVHGTEIVRGLLAVSEKYYKLCCLIRFHQADDFLVRESLQGIGFNKVRISEVLRVSKSSPAIWSEFEARSLSFRGALDLNRGTVKLLTMVPDDGSGPVVESERWLEEHAEQEHSEAIQKEESGADKKSSSNLDNDAMEACARKLARYAEKLKRKSKSFVLENGYTVKVYKTKAGRGGNE